MSVLLAIAAVVAAVGPPAPALRSGDDHVTMARGSYCWASEPNAEGQEEVVCADLFAPVPKRTLRVDPGGHVRLNTRTPADRVFAWLGSGRPKLRVARVDAQRFRVSVPGGMRRARMLHVLARYPRGDGGFVARIAPR